MAQYKRPLFVYPQKGVTLELEHWSEDLSPAQKVFYSRAEREYNDIASQLQDIMKNQSTEVLASGEEVMVLQVNGTQNTVFSSTPKNMSQIPSLTFTRSVPQSSIKTISAVANQSIPAIGSQSVVLQGPPSLCQTGSAPTSVPVSTAQYPAPGGGTIQLVMSPRLGLIVGAVQGQDVRGSTAPIVQPNAVPTVTVPKKTNLLAEKSQTQSQPPRAVSVAKIAKVNPISQQSLLQQFPTTTTTTTVPKVALSSAPSKTAVPSPTIRIKPRILATNEVPSQSAKTTTTSSTSTVSATIPPPPSAKTAETKTTASSNNANRGIRVANTVGGVSTMDKVLEDAAGLGAAPDSREVAFNKVAGKTFPSLVVLARPHLRDKEMTAQFVAKERGVLDAQVKSVLVYSPTKFTEWLIQQGLVRSEQVCPVHTTPDGNPTKLKLGMYSDVSKFPFSGGYVWISDCCPQRFVSVFSGSIFEGSPHPPSTLLKLMYHWCCQTNVQNVVHWVKVDNFYVKNFFTNMRTVCTAAVHEKYEMLGGKNKTIEVGVISLGTTSQGGNMRQVKVEVLGVMDPESKRIRLRAVDPVQDGERVYKRRFIKILEPLEQWVDKESVILTDYTVDKSTLHTMGFRHVYQVALNESASGSSHGNQNVMDYLRRIVPRMFQNTLSLLSRQIIQQFLDELVWREKWGPIPLDAFNNIILHLSQQTKINSGESLLLRLARIASNPFRDWRYLNWSSATAQQQSSSRPPGIAGTATTPSNATSSTSGDLQVSNVKKTYKRPAPSDDAHKGTLATSEIKRNRAAAEELTLEDDDEDPDDPAPVENGPSPDSRASPDSSSRSSAVAKSKDPFTLNTDEMISLDQFYFASKNGDPKIISREFKTDGLNSKCCICQKIFATNIEVMLHIMAHSLTWEKYKEGDEDTMADVVKRMCRYCLALFTDASQVQPHIEEVHCKRDDRPTCLICETKFRDRRSLIVHMQKTHLEAEMPYRCGICDHRCSEKRVVIDHFYEVHAKGEEVQCPFCLRCVIISKNGRKVGSNIYFFYNHVRKHQLKYLLRTCNRCCLSFVHKDTLKDHLNNDHESNKGAKGLSRYAEPEAVQVMMPVLSEEPDQSLPRKRFTPRLPYFTARDLDLTVLLDSQTHKCYECKEGYITDNHLQHHMTCLMCRYATCCPTAMTSHRELMHGNRPKQGFPTTTPLTLQDALYCPCGFASNCANSLARHLGSCSWKTVYPTEDEANKKEQRAEERAKEVSSSKDMDMVTFPDNSAIEGMMVKRTRRRRIPRVTSVQERLDAIKLYEEGITAAEVAQIYNVSTKRISKWIKNRDKITTYCNSSTKQEPRFRMSERPEQKTADTLLLTWFTEQRKKGIPVSGPMLKEKALLIHKDLGTELSFKASNGWLWGFKRRFGICKGGLAEGKPSADGSREPSEISGDVGGLVMRTKSCTNDSVRRKWRYPQFSDDGLVSDQTDSEETDVDDQIDFSKDEVDSLKDVNDLKDETGLENETGLEEKTDLEDATGLEDETSLENRTSLESETGLDNESDSEDETGSDEEIGSDEKTGSEEQTGSEATTGLEKLGLLKENSRKKQGKTSVQQRLDAMKLVQDGQEPKVIAKLLNIHPSRISKWMKNRDKMTTFCSPSNTSGKNAEKILRIKQRIDKAAMEKSLYTWFSEQREKGLRVKGKMLKEKALRIRKNLGTEFPFKASDGWLWNFKRRFGISKPSSTGEKPSADDSASDTSREPCEVFVKENVSKMGDVDPSSFLAEIDDEVEGSVDVVLAEMDDGDESSVDAVPAKMDNRDEGLVDAVPAEMDDGDKSSVDAVAAKMHDGDEGLVDAVPAKMDDGDEGLVDAVPAKMDDGDEGSVDAVPTKMDDVDKIGPTLTSQQAL